MNPSCCALCALALPKNPVIVEERSFCCSGCQMVFQIIGGEVNFHEHTLFQEALKAGVISNPDLVELEKEDEGLKLQLQIEDMWCPACAEVIRILLLRKKGINRVVVDYATDLSLIRFDPKILSKEEIIGIINKLGYRTSELLAPENNRLSRSYKLRFAFALFCSMNIMMFSYPLYASHFGSSIEGYGYLAGWLSFALTIPLMSYCASPIWKRLILSFKSGWFGMESLVALGTVTAFILSTYNLVLGRYHLLYYDSLSMVISFVLLGKILEKRAKFSVKESFISLTRSLPKKGCKRQTGGEWSVVPLKEINCGDTLLVRIGEKIVLDGEVVAGSGVVDEAVMTGEATPIFKRAGSQVVGGSIVKQGSLEYRVLKDLSSSLIGQIVHWVEKDLAKKSGIEQLVNKITVIFTPLVLALGAALFFFSGIERMLSALLISCPCALGIAVPLAQSRLLYRFAQKGGLVRNRANLNTLAQNPLFVFDKTGTLTEGKFTLLKGLENLSSLHLGVLKTLASHSNHPIAISLAASLTREPVPLDSIQEHIGRGMEGRVDQTTYLLGSQKLLIERGVSGPLEEARGNTVVYFAANGNLITAIHLGDRLRPRLPKVEGIVLSGDSDALVQAVVKQTGLLWGKGGLNPLEKREEILRLKQKKRPVVMVGDGVNDAPAMTAADLGISVVSGSDLAVEVSDILLTTEHLDALPQFCQTVQKSQKVIFQNLFWAFFYNSLALILAAFGVLNPLIAALAMAISSLFVTLNSLRI